MPADGSVERMVMGWMKLSYSTPSTMYMTSTAASSNSSSLVRLLRKASAAPWKVVRMLSGSPTLVLGVLDGRYGGAERGALAQVEGNRGRRKLRQVIDEQRPGLDVDLGDRRQRHLAAGRRRHVDGGERVHGLVGGRIRLHDHAVLIRLGEDRRHDALAEGIVQRVVDGAHADAEARRAVAVDGDVGRKPVVFLVADDVRELGLLAKRCQQLGRPGGQAAESALSRVNWYWVRLTVLSRVRSCTGCMYSVMPATSAVSARSRRMTSATLRAALGARLQVDQEAPAVQRDIVAVDADEGRQAPHIRDP